jgi:hypothetical protein
MPITTHYFADALSVTPEQVADVIREQLAITEYGQTDALRTAVMYLPATMSPAVWVAGAKLAGINQGTARNRMREVRNYQREIRELLPNPFMSTQEDL